MEPMKDNTEGTTVFTAARSTLSRVTHRALRRRHAAARPLPHQVAVRADGERGEQLRRLHDEYVWDVNSALEDGREDLVRGLSDAYADDASLVLAAAPGVRR